MNKVNEFKYLKDWCDAYYETMGLKIHPSNVPVDVVLDDIMGKVTTHLRHIEMITTTLELITQRFKEQEEKIKSLEFGLNEGLVAIVELERRTGNQTLETAATIIKKRKPKNE